MTDESNIKLHNELEDHGKNMRAIIEEVIEEMCTKYCKYPDIWDEETWGELFDSDVCQNCPLNKL